MAREPQRRYVSAQHLAQALEVYLQHQPGQARAQLHEQPELLEDVVKIGADSVTRQGEFKRALGSYGEAVE
jgi:hypothetical protein